MVLYASENKQHLSNQFKVTTIKRTSQKEEGTNSAYLQIHTSKPAEGL